MNPSASGWTKKLLNDLSDNEGFLQLPLNDFYRVIKASGFIYGSNVSVIYDCIENHDFTHEELCKINLFLGFYFNMLWALSFLR